MAHRPGHDAPPRLRGWLAGVAVGLAAATLVGGWLLRPTGENRPDVSMFFPRQIFEARVVAAREAPCPGEPQEGVRCRRVTYRLEEGPEAGRMASQEFVGGAATPSLEPGDEVLLSFDPGAEDPFRYRFYDRRRGSALVWLALAFAAAVVALGRLRGLTALAGLAASLVVLVTYVLPAVLDGRSPLLVAIVGASAIAYLALYLAHGFSTMTTVALLGTLGSLAVTALLAELFVGLSELSGFSEEGSIVQLFTSDAGAARIDLAGILLGGVVIGALGAIDDMTVTQASAVWELREANPDMPRGSLLRSGLRIGRDHVASTVNTLALAYAGSSMAVLLLIVLSRQSLGTVLNGEVIATELVRTLVGSIGLVLAVPLTTWLAVRAAPVAGSAPVRTNRPRG